MTDSTGGSPYTPAEREAVRERIAAERAGTAEQMAALSRDFEAIVEANALVAVDDEHDPEGSITAFERAHVAALLARAREHLAELDLAAERLETGDYGLCEQCGRAIPAARLEARPAATTCVGCADGRAGRRR
ncbi:TraR/DksA family transcriptional regulator [Streptomyces sp. NPDC057554]|uniref:TraR/DksA family transcriptional regulator n=1 Tax=Streptomyces sp. NPDC057554 TaxID=3350538 RepID=UPI0036A2043E